MPLTREDAVAHPAFAAPNWYYSLELAPGAVTRGGGFRNVALTRELLRRTGVEGRRCLDLGMMEGLITILLERRGASRVVAYDRVNRAGKLGLIRSALDCHFEHIAGMSLADLPAALGKRGHAPFDVVVFSGILYHMFDPLGGLASVRSMVRDGGIVIVETQAVFNDEMAGYFNAKGRFATGTNYWELSAGLLEYLLRLLRLRPLDCAWYFGEAFRYSDPQVGRLAIACRAVDQFLPEPDDRWMRNEQLALDFAEFIDWKRTASDAPAVPYDDSREGLIRRSPPADAGLGINLPASIRSVPEFEVRDDQVCLALDARI